MEEESLVSYVASFEKTIESPIEQALDLRFSDDENPENIKKYLFGPVAAAAALVSHRMKLSKNDGIFLLVIFRRMLLDEGYSSLSPGQQRDDRLKCQRILDWGGGSVLANKKLIDEFCNEMTISNSKEWYAKAIEANSTNAYFRNGGLKGALAQSAKNENQIPSRKTSGGSKFCFIATACFGSCDADTVIVFRRYRETVLRQTSVGRLAIYWYYMVSPFFAKLIYNHALLKKIISWMLGKIAARLKIKYRWLS